MLLLTPNLSRLHSDSDPLWGFSGFWSTCEPLPSRRHHPKIRTVSDPRTNHSVPIQVAGKWSDVCRLWLGCGTRKTQLKYAGRLWLPGRRVTGTSHAVRRGVLWMGFCFLECGILSRGCCQETDTCSATCADMHTYLHFSNSGGPSSWAPCSDWSCSSRTARPPL